MEGTEISIFKISNKKYECIIKNEKRESKNKGTFFYDYFDHSKIILKKNIGEGSYGKIYKCDFICNIKNTNNIPNNVVLKIFENEKYVINEFKIIEIINKRKNDNIIDFYGCFKFNKYGCIIMEYAELHDLNTFLKKDNYEQNIINNIALDICYGIGFLHQNNLIHGDLKPNNILIFENKNENNHDKKYIAKLIDFGLSGFEKKNKKKDKYKYIKKQNSYAILFKPPKDYKCFNPTINVKDRMYKAKRKIGKREDIYSLGILLLQLFQQEDNPFHAYSFKTIKKTQEEINQEKLMKNIKEAIEIFYADEYYAKYIRELIFYCVKDDINKNIADIIGMLKKSFLINN